MCFYLAVFENNLIGCIGLKKIDKESVLLSRFYVVKSYRRKGIGEKLYQKVLDYTYKHKFKNIYLGVDEVSKSGICFYEKHGFKIVNDRKFISEDDENYYSGNYICSKRLKENIDYIPWNNKNLHLRDYYSKCKGSK